jgi:hypothetical protein
MTNTLSYCEGLSQARQGGDAAWCMSRAQAYYCRPVEDDPLVPYLMNCKRQHLTLSDASLYFGYFYSIILCLYIICAKA